MQAQEFSQKKKIDMPIKNLCLKIWLAAPFLSPMDTLSKENMVGFSPSFACISFPIKIKYKLERHLDFSKTQSLPSTLPFFFFKRRTWAYIYKHFGKWPVANCVMPVKVVFFKLWDPKIFIWNKTLIQFRFWRPTVSLTLAPNLKHLCVGLLRWCLLVDME